VSVISTATRRVIATIGVGLYPVGVAFSPDGSRGFVTNDCSGTVSVIRTATRHVIGTVIAPCHPASVAVSPDSTHIYVAHNNRRDGIMTTTDVTLSARAQRMADSLATWPRRRVQLTELWELLDQADPSSRMSVWRRRILSELITELTAADVAELPAARS
jgi:YVTN family beta-propeller protein